MKIDLSCWRRGPAARLSGWRRALAPRAPFAAVATYFFLNGAMWPSIASRIPAIAANDHLGPGLLGSALLGQAIGLAGAMPFSGRLVNRWGAKRVAPIAAVAYAGCTALPGWAPNAVTLFVALMIWGVANAPLDAAAQVLAGGLPKPARGSVFVRLELSFSAGMLSGAGVGAWLASRISVEAHLSLVAAAGILVALLAARFQRGAAATTPDVESGSEPYLPYIPRHAATHRLWPGDPTPRHAGAPTFRLRRIGYRARFARLTLLAMAGLWMEAVVPDWSGLFMQHELGAGPSQYVLGNLVFFVALTAAQLPATKLPQRLWYAAIVTGAGVFAGGMALAATAGTVPVAVVGFALCGAGAANIHPLASETALLIFGNDGRVVVRAQTPPYLALAVEKPITGLLASVFGYRRALASTIVIAATAFALGFSVRKTE